MPTIYRIACEACRGSSPVEGGWAGCAVDDPRRGTLTQGWYRAVLVPSGRFAPLLHPAEAACLKATGYSWLGASVRGRLFMVTQVLCEDCGAVSERRSPDVFSFEVGCLCFVLGPLLGLLGGLRHALLLGLGAVGAACAAHGVLLGLAHLAHRRRVREHRFRGCESCGSRKVVPVPSAGRRRFPCPRCGGRHVSVNVAGRS